MRAMPLAAWMLAGLGVLMLGADPASAGGRGDEAGRQRPAASSTRHGAVGTAHARQHASLQAETVAPLRGRLASTHDQQAALSQRAAACTGKRSRCGARAAGWSTSSWAGGLEPAEGVQAAECPDGTMATLARGHDDVIRCMPI